MNHVELLPIQPDEAELFARELIKMTPWRELGYQAETLRKYLMGKEEGFQAMSLRVKGGAAGVITLRSPWLRGTLLELLAILPGYQHQGLGKWLIQWLVEFAQVNKQRNLWTLVSAFNAPAIRFYETSGFKKIGELEDFIIEGQNENLLRFIIDSTKPDTPREAK